MSTSSGDGTEIAAAVRTGAVTRTVLDAMNEGLVIVDAAGVIVHANPAAGEILGYRGAHLVGATLERILPPSAHGAHVGHVAGFFAAPRRRPMGADLDLAAVRSDGTQVPVEVSISYFDLEGVRYGIAVFSDISARVEAQRQLAESIESLSQFAGWVAHDLRNGVAEMSGIAHALVEQAGDDADELVAAIADSGDRLAGVVSGLLSFARASAGAPVELVAVDLAAAMDEVLPRIDRRAESSAVAISVDDALPVALGVREWVVEVLYNLVLNGVLHGGPNGGIEITSVAAGRGEVAVRISDRGPGLPDAVVDALTDGGLLAGHGLGLHIARSILDRIGGRLEYEGSAEGAVFRVVLRAP